MPNLWMSDAIRVDGPADQVGYPEAYFSPKRGDVKHSAVVNWGRAIPNGNSDFGSWQFTVMKDGRIYQHYSADVNCWHAGDIDPDGGVSGNFDLIGIEHEGGAPPNYSEPLTNAQVGATVAITRWLAQTFGRHPVYSRYPDQRGWTLVEHRQVSNSPTACPSGRIPWSTILEALFEEDLDMAPPYGGSWLADRYFVVVARGSDNQLWQRFWSAGGVWSNWALLPGGALLDDPTMTVQPTRAS